MGVVVRRYIDILTMLLIFPINYTPLVLVLFLAAASLLFCSFLKCFFGLVSVIFLTIYSKRYSKNIVEIVQKNRDPANIIASGASLLVCSIARAVYYI